MMRIIIILSVILIPFGLEAQFWGYSTPKLLDGTVNTLSGEESSPVFSNDSSLLYFTRTFDEKNTGKGSDQDVWVSERIGHNKYVNDQLLKNVNNKYHNTVIGVSQDGNSLYLFESYKGRKVNVKGISSSKLVDGEWSEPVSIIIPNLNIEGDYQGFSINKTEDVILISYAGPLSLGKEDLYVSTKSTSGWSSPLHMGSNINSAGYEISPFLTESQDTLYFSSNGFGGNGDADIFYSVKQGGWSEWSAPINLGNVINSNKFDAYFSCSAYEVMWSSNRDNNHSDIYVASILPPPALSVSIIGKDVTEYEGSNGVIDAVIKGGVGPFSILWSNGFTSEDIASLKVGVYSVTITDFYDQTVTKSYKVNGPDKPEVIEKPIVLPEVRFAFNKWELLTDDNINSTDSLIFIYDLLMKFPSMILELSAHTDSRGSVSINKKLSENRARTCYKYLIQEKNIDPRRIIPIGKGKSELRTIWRKDGIYLLAKPEDMKDVQELILTDVYIDQFKSTNVKLFRILHQLNRRTEAKLISLDFDVNNTPAADPEYLNFVK